MRNPFEDLAEPRRELEQDILLFREFETMGDQVDKLAEEIAVMIDRARALGEADREEIKWLVQQILLPFAFGIIGRLTDEFCNVLRLNTLTAGQLH